MNAQTNRRQYVVGLRRRWGFAPSEARISATRHLLHSRGLWKRPYSGWTWPKGGGLEIHVYQVYSRAFTAEAVNRGIPFYLWSLVADPEFREVYSAISVTSVKSTNDYAPVAKENLIRSAREAAVTLEYDDFQSSEHLSVMVESGIVASWGKPDTDGILQLNADRKSLDFIWHLPSDALTGVRIRVAPADVKEAPGGFMRLSISELNARLAVGAIPEFGKSLGQRLIRTLPGPGKKSEFDPALLGILKGRNRSIHIFGQQNWRLAEAIREAIPELDLHERGTTITAHFASRSLIRTNTNPNQLSNTEARHENALKRFQSLAAEVNNKSSKTAKGESEQTPKEQDEEGPKPLPALPPHINLRLYRQWLPFTGVVSRESYEDGTMHFRFRFAPIGQESIRSDKRWYLEGERTISATNSQNDSDKADATSPWLDLAITLLDGQTSQDSESSPHYLWFYSPDDIHRGTKSVCAAKNLDKYNPKRFKRTRVKNSRNRQIEQVQEPEREIRISTDLAKGSSLTLPGSNSTMYPWVAHVLIVVYVSELLRSGEFKGVILQHRSSKNASSGLELVSNLAARVIQNDFHPDIEDTDGIKDLLQHSMRPLLLSMRNRTSRWKYAPHTSNVESTYKLLKDGFKPKTSTDGTEFIAPHELRFACTNAVVREFRAATGEYFNPTKEFIVFPLDRYFFQYDSEKQERRIFMCYGVRTTHDCSKDFAATNPLFKSIADRDLEFIQWDSISKRLMELNTGNRLNTVLSAELSDSFLGEDGLFSERSMKNNSPKSTS